MKRVAVLAIAVLTAPVLASCRTASPQQPSPIVQPGGPGDSTRVLSPESVAALPRPAFTTADVTFMQGMIGHHSQAVDMVDLLKKRSMDDGLRQLGQRIEVSQVDEIKLMQHWLEDRGQAVPDPHAMHMHGATLMPGMLSADEMTQLAAAKGIEFDRLFLKGMIKHHGGALTMVTELFSSPGAGQDADIYAFASDVEADQRMEITRMASMLKERQR
ncbi:MAG: DUF305 domain-containing protein [Vicinamibacterales bacterium]